MNIINELFKALFTAIWELFKIVPTVLDFIDIPTSKYGLIEFLIKHNVVFFGNTSFTKLILFVVPLAVEVLCNYFIKKLKIRDRESKENIKILLYIGLLYLVSLWYFWLAVGIIVLIIVIIVIYRFIIVNKPR